MSKQGPAGEGDIQPFGFLVALAPDWRVSRVSANIEDFIGRTPGAVLGQPVADLFASDAVHSLRNRLALLRNPNSIEHLFSIALTSGETLYDVALHMSGSTVVIEAEPSRDHRHDRDSTGTIRGMIAQLEPIEALPTFFAEAARQVRALTGFDRVLIQRLGADVPAGEALRSGARSMSDTLGAPLSTASRPVLTVIADTGALPIALLAPANARPSPLDLSHSMLLASPPDRVAALREAGIGATISLPLIVAGRLWGEINCTHRAPCCPGFERRSALEWFALMLGMQIEVRELKARLDAAA